jgi:hypothetical protein
MTANKMNTPVFNITLLFNDSLIKYHKIIMRGGMMDMTVDDDEGDFTNQVTIFKRESFVEYFRNLWNNHF